MNSRFALRVLAVGTVLAGFACDEKKPSVPVLAPVAVPSSPAPSDPSPAPAVISSGAIEGEVVFAGPAPEPQPLKRGSDPVCGKTEVLDETVLVKDGKLANVFVRVVQGAPSAPAPTDPVHVDQLECMYRPRVQGALAGQKVVVRNSDGTFHNVHTYAETKTLRNQAQPPGAPALEQRYEAGTGVVKFKCDVHPWMTGYVHVVENPFFATSGADGKFRIQGLPAGNYTLEAWHEKLGTRTAELTVKETEPTRHVFTFAAEAK